MRRARLVRVGAALALLHLVLPSSAQTGNDPTAGTGFVVVPLDLASRTFGGLLPFDVPFQIQAAAPPGVDRIEVQYQESTTPFAAGTQAGEPLCEKRACATDGGPWRPSPPIVWNASGLTDGNAKFTVLINPPLDANRFYRFRFAFDKKLTDAQAAEFNAVARQAIDATLQGIERADVLSARVEPLRQELIGRLKCLAEACSIHATGRLFDPQQPPAAVRDEWLATLARLLDPQAKRNQGVSAYRLGQDALRTALQKVAAHPALGALAAGLRARARDDAGAQTLLQEFEPALTLVAPEDPQTLTRAALCLDATPRPQLDQTWSAEDAQACAAAYRVTGTRLSSLKTLVERQLAQGAVAPADVASLQELVRAGGPLFQAGDMTEQLAFNADAVGRALERRARLLDDAAGYTGAVARDSLLLDASTTGGDSTIRNNYVSADAGFIYAFTIASFVPYVGTNIYFRPVNKAAPLSQRGSFGRRFALTFGVTLATLEDKEPGDTAARTRTDLFSNSSLVLGAGLRVTQSIRLGGGALVFKRKDPNPLVSNTTVGVAPYASFSFDLDVAKAFAGLGKIFSGG